MERTPPALRMASAPPAPAADGAKLTLRKAVAALETRMLEALIRAPGNCARAARELGITARVV